MGRDIFIDNFKIYLHVSSLLLAVHIVHLSKFFAEVFRELWSKPTKVLSWKFQNRPALPDPNLYRKLVQSAVLHTPLL